MNQQAGQSWGSTEGRLSTQVHSSILREGSLKMCQIHVSILPTANALSKMKVSSVLKYLSQAENYI